MTLMLMLMMKRTGRTVRTLGPFLRPASSSSIQDHHTKFELPPWPKSKDPAPVDIFHLSTNDFKLSQRDFNKHIKTIYNKYLKIYHPDILNQQSIYDENQKLMTDPMKRARFDSIQQAYEILRDPKRRVAYSRSQNTSWESYSKTQSSFDAYRMANAHRKQYDFKQDEDFWKAGTWEDYYNMKYGRAPPTQEEFDKNKYKILIGVLTIAAITTSIQLMLAFENYNNTKYQLQLQDLALMQDSNNNYNLRGELNTRFSSIRRMLLHRRSGIEDDELLRVREEEDARVLTEYARMKTGHDEALNDKHPELGPPEPSTRH